MGDMLSRLNKVKIVLLAFLSNVQFTNSTLQVLRKARSGRSPQELMQLWGAHIGIDQQDPAAALAGQNLRQIRGYECFAFRRGGAGDQEEIGIGIPDGFDTFGPQLVELEYLGILRCTRIRQHGWSKNCLGLRADLDGLTGPKRFGRLLCLPVHQACRSLLFRLFQCFVNPTHEIPFVMERFEPCWDLSSCSRTRGWSPRF